MSVLWLVRLVVTATLLALPLFGVASTHTSLLGNGLATVNAQTLGQPTVQDIEDEDDDEDEALTDEAMPDEAMSVDEDSTYPENGNGAEQEAGD